MNIFMLDRDVNVNAQYHCDKHVVKMVLEYTQLLCSVMHANDYEDIPYKKTHFNHPCAIWARWSLANYQYLWDLTDALGKEYTYRYGKVHKSHKLLIDGFIPRNIKMKSTDLNLDFPNCTSIKDGSIGTDIVNIYREYYKRDKAYMISYKKRNAPKFLHY